MPTDYKKLYAIRSKNKKLIKQVCPTMQDRSGIYYFGRTDKDTGEKCAYVGQSRLILSRCADHLAGREQHIDLSLYKRKLYSETNPYGWKVGVLTYCSEEELDKLEIAYIKKFQDMGIRLYNVTGGGQLDKESDIGERLQVKLKNYKKGKSLGAEKTRTYVKTMFDKYLDFAIKPPANKIKERKAEEFKNWLENGEN